MKKKLFDLDVNVTQNVVQYPVYYVTYAQFEVAMTNSLRGDVFTRKKHY